MSGEDAELLDWLQTSLAAWESSTSRIFLPTVAAFGTNCGCANKILLGSMFGKSSRQTLLCDTVVLLHTLALAGLCHLQQHGDFASSFVSSLRK